MDDLAVAQIFLHRYSAEMAKELLANNGIYSVVVTDDLGGAGPNFTYLTGNIRLLVNKEDLSTVKKLLKLILP